MKQRITAQLESANWNIKTLEDRLERLRGSEQGPPALAHSLGSSQHRRPRPPMLNGHGTSPTSLLSAGVRPRVNRQGSSFTERGIDSPRSTPTHASPSHAGSPAPPALDDETVSSLRISVRAYLRRLRDVSHREGKGKEVDRGDDGWEALNNLAELFKKNPGLQQQVDMHDVLHCTMPFLADSSSVSQRAAAYRLLRYTLTRRNWGLMLNAGIEFVVIR